jgi:hypothetical protein
VITFAQDSSKNPRIYNLLIYILFMAKIKRRRNYAIIILIIILAVLVLFSFLRAYIQYSNWKTQHNYFENPNPKIESWMTIKMISEQFNLTTTDILAEMKINNTPVNKHLTLELYCKQYHKDCTELIQRLNQHIRK